MQACESWIRVVPRSMSRSSLRKPIPGLSGAVLRSIRAGCDKRLTMAKAARESGDEKLANLFAEFGGHMVSPGGAAQLLGLSRKTVYTLL